jgi:hypothetical protein
MNFLTFSKVIINPRFIQKILNKPDYYEIHLTNLEKSCTILMGSGGFTFEPEIWKISKGSPDSKILLKHLNIKND